MLNQVSPSLLGLEVWEAPLVCLVGRYYPVVPLVGGLAKIGSFAFATRGIMGGIWTYRWDRRPIWLHFKGQTMYFEGMITFFRSVFGCTAKKLPLWWASSSKISHVFRMLFAVFSMYLHIFLDTRSDVGLVGWNAVTFHQAFRIPNPKGTL